MCICRSEVTMSSVVSMRSYERRQKSAGPRLERTRSNTPLIPSISVSAPSDHNGPPAAANESAVKVTPRRAMSARERKREHETSDIFPEVEKSRVDPEWGVTKYSEDFGPKTVTPVSMRPISPTRKNNPHPSQAFMKWQYPVRIHKHQKAVPPPPDAWRYINERFYEDYTDTYNTGDAKNEVPVTNLAKIEFPGTKKRHSINGYTSTPHLFSGVTGTKAKLNPRYLQKENATDQMPQSLKPLRPPSPQSRMIQNTIKGNTLPVFKEWLKTASSSERDVVLQMLHAANDDSQEIRMNKALSLVLQGDSADKVQEWLKHTNESERLVVLRVLETLALATAENEVSMQHSQPIGLQFMYPGVFGGSLGHHRRGYTYPISLQGHHHSSRSTHHHGNHHSRHHHHHHRSSKKKREQKDEGYSSSSVLSDTHSGFGLVGKKLTTRRRKEEKPGKQEEGGGGRGPVLWHNRILKKHTGATSFHAGGIFDQPQRDKGQHFSIHPEWPTA